MVTWIVLCCAQRFITKHYHVDGSAFEEALTELASMRMVSVCVRVRMCVCVRVPVLGTFFIWPRICENVP